MTPIVAFALGVFALATLWALASVSRLWRAYQRPPEDSERRPMMRRAFLAIATWELAVALVMIANGSAIPNALGPIAAAGMLLLSRKLLIR